MDAQSPGCQRRGAALAFVHVGVGALLHRELLAIPHAFFGFLENNEGKVTPLWPTARRELQCICRLVPLIYCDLACPLLPILFATDAMESDESGFGGWGVVATQPAHEDLVALFQAAVGQGSRCAGSMARSNRAGPRTPFC